MAHIWLFTMASRDDPGLRRSVTGLACSTAIGVTLLAAASLTGGVQQGALWAIAIAFDVGVPFLFFAEGWKLQPSHFAERHGLIVIIALGESIVSIGVGAHEIVDGGIIAASVLGVALAAALWWLYFDVIVWLGERRLSQATPGKEQNELARDSYSIIHFPLVAGIVLTAVGLKKTLVHVGDPLHSRQPGTHHIQVILLSGKRQSVCKIKWAVVPYITVSQRIKTKYLTVDLAESTAIRHK
jgi:low temperature requirement protein LtrA